MKNGEARLILPYRRPRWVMRNLFDPLAVFLVGRLGLDDHNGTRVIEVKGRTSGIWRLTPVRVLDLNQRQYVVAVYGESNWAKNLRSQGRGRLRWGNHVEEFRAVELSGKEKIPVLRAYLKRWWGLVSRMTPVASPDAPDEEIAKAAPFHPVFLLDWKERTGG